ncbi:uncharacterized protein LOC121732745 [Aricia agestis]|uniref:uncharacterized protein LOC121732745 n=1 Tax=Aricia agestis TaxID=91739 RepID=UPI001C20233E|nr:uncharacterized protein LOC121732745 [Aricia agestis]
MDNSENSEQGEVVAVGRSTQLVINFAPDSTDTETLRLKCMNFWRVIEEDPEINWWRNVPKNKPEELLVTQPDVRSENRIPTAIDMLDFAKKKGLFDLVYGTKRRSWCVARTPVSGLPDIAEGHKPAVIVVTADMGEERSGAGKRITQSEKISSYSVS